MNRKARIILPTLYSQYEEPKNPRYGDIWQGNGLRIYLDKWFEVNRVVDDEEYLEKLEEKEDEARANLRKKIKDLRNALTIIKNFMEEQEE